MHVTAHVWRLEDISVESVLASTFRCFAFGGLNSGDWAFTSAFPALAGPQKYILNVKNSDFRHFF